MTIPLERLIEGLITTMRTDVIPGVPDGYAKGQAIGIVDILNGIRGRVEWTREPALESVRAKLALLDKVRALLPGLPDAQAGGPPETLSSTSLFAERDRLDALVGEALKSAFAAGPGPAPEEALTLIKAHMHDEAKREMKLTRKPLFAEIASGGSKPT